MQLFINFTAVEWFFCWNIVGIFYVNLKIRNLTRIFEKEYKIRTFKFPMMGFYGIMIEKWIIVFVIGMWQIGLVVKTCTFLIDEIILKSMWWVLGWNWDWRSARMTLSHIDAQLDWRIAEHALFGLSFLKLSDIEPS